MSSVLTWLLLLRLLGPVMSFQAYEGVPYKTVGVRTLRADVYVPVSRSGPVPAVVVVHGGMWDFGQRTDNADFARFVASNGVAAVLIDLRDASVVGFDSQIADVKDAIRWIRARADLYNIDPGRIGLLGSSSGGHLASLAAYAGNGEGFGDDPPGTSSRVGACLFLYGPYDPGALAASGTLQAPFAMWYLGGDPTASPETYARYSAATYVDGSEPPTLLIHGTEDVLVPLEQAERLEACLNEANVPVELVVVPRLGHGFVRKQPWLRPWMARVVADFFLEAM